MNINKEKIDKLYEIYTQKVMFSSNAYDFNIISIKQSDINPVMAEFKIGDIFTREQFEEQMNTNEWFKKRWGNI